VERICPTAWGMSVLAIMQSSRPSVVTILMCSSIDRIYSEDQTVKKYSVLLSSEYATPPRSSELKIDETADLEADQVELMCA